MPSRSESRKTTYLSRNSDIPTNSPVGQEARIGRDGTLFLREFVLPPSNLWSPEYRDFYVQRTAFLTNQASFSVPARTASKAEWDAFDAQQERALQESLSCALARYPVDVLDTRIAGVRVGIVSPRSGCKSENQHRVLIHLRGGGFVHNRGLTFGQIESVPVSEIGGIKVITVDYRQAPFHRHPAGSEDVEAIYRELLTTYAPGAIGIFGCSAGGMLAAQAVARFQTKGLPRPGAVGVLSIAPPPPCVPAPHGWGESAMWFSGVPGTEFSENDRRHWEPTGWYMEGADSTDPAAYPGSSDSVLAAFPPTLLMSGTRDFALSTTVVAHTRFLKLGVDASLYIMEGGVHGAHAVAVGTPEAHDAQSYIAQWFTQHLER
jgi:epsilon-lactone hydrolase